MRSCDRPFLQRSVKILNICIYFENIWKYFLFFSFLYKLFFFFHNNFKTYDLIFITFFFEMSPSHLDTTVNFAEMRQYKVCVSFSLNICLIYKSRKNWRILRNLATFQQLETWVSTRKIVIVCYILFTGTLQNLEYLF